MTSQEAWGESRHLLSKAIYTVKDVMSLQLQFYRSFSVSSDDLIVSVQE